MHLKRFKKNLWIVIVFTSTIAFTTIVPRLEKKIFQDSSLSKKYLPKFLISNPVFTEGLSKQKDFLYIMYIDDQINKESKVIFKNLKQQIKTALNQSTAVVKFTKSTDNLIIDIDSEKECTVITKLLKKNPAINLSKDNSKILVSIKPSYLGKKRNELIEKTVNIISNRLHNQKLKHFTIKNNLNDTLTITVYDDNVENININNQHSCNINAVTIDNANGKESLIFTEQDIEKINWIPYENYFLLSLQLNKSAKDRLKTMDLKTASMVWIIAKDLHVDQKESHGGFAVKNDKNNCFLGFVSLENGIMGQLIIQTVFDEKSKEQIEEYYSRGNLLTQISFKDSKFVGNIKESITVFKNHSTILFIMMAIILIICCLLIISGFTLMIATNIKYGFMTITEYILNLLIIYQSIIFFNISIDIKILTILFMGLGWMGLVSSWKTVQINHILRLEYANWESYITACKVKMDRINNRVNLINVLILFFSTIIGLFCSANLKNSFAVLVITCFAILITHMLFWDNLVLYSVASDKYKIK